MGSPTTSIGTASGLTCASTAHAKGGAFIWFDSIYAATTIHEWLTATQAAYTDIAAMGVIQPQDVIVLINYSGRLPSVPEAVDGQAAELTTGIAYWLLHQP